MFSNLRARASGYASGAEAKIGSAAASARGTVNERLQRAQDLARNRADYTELRQNLNAYVGERTHAHAAALKEAGYGIKDKASAQWDRSKKEAERKLFDLSVPIRAKVLLALRESVKSSLVADPDMCQCIKTRVEDLVDVFWDDIRITVDKTMDDKKEATLGQAETDVDVLGSIGVEPQRFGPRWWRAKILYHLLPYDLSIFGNLKDPCWWILTFFMCMPNFSFLPEPFNEVPVRVPFFVLYLILVATGCPADEFQLVTYIMSIKGLQFLCSGIGMMCFAAYTYYMCVHPGGTHTCDETGPGAKVGLVVSLADWLGTCILVWVAFLWLPCSERSAGTREAVLDDDEDEEDQEVGRGTRFGSTGYHADRGGRLKGWLGYDLGCFLLSVAACYFLMAVDLGHLRPGGRPSEGFSAATEVWDDGFSEAQRWTGHAAIFWARIVYALLSFPFLFFWIPGLQGVLTHTRITGYNRNGVCVPYTLHPVKSGKKKKPTESGST